MGYGQFCPVAKAAEVVAERWTPLILREVLCGGSHTFGDIQRGVPQMSRSLLSKRLKQLERAGLIERRTAGSRFEYHPTEGGVELKPIIESLGAWGQRWARAEVSRDDLDPRLLMWDMRRGINTESLPRRRVVVGFRFTDVPGNLPARTWMILERDAIDVCYKDPGFEVDLLITTHLRKLIRVWMGDVAFPDAGIVVDGRRELARSFPRWLSLSPFARVDRPASPA